MSDNENLLAVSRAGHDKNEIYVVRSMDETYVMLVNGANRTLDHPKRKKRMHVQLIRHLDRSLKEACSHIQNDGDVRAVLQMYAGTFADA